MSNSLTMGRVALTVNDLKKVGQWYETTVGLHLLARDGETARYGVGDETLVELRQDKAARQRDRREAGLFHTAFLLPDRASLGLWLLDASAKRGSIDGAADHGVSEALYLTDPEGNGVEIYVDRPRKSWKTHGAQVEMVSDPLDMEDLVASAHGARRWQGVPPGSTIGHVHLQVGTVPQAEAFYKGVLGLDITAQLPGATFYAADGYHHHIATNSWNSRGAGPRNLPSTGLTEVEIHLSAARAQAIRDKTKSNQVARRLDLADPWGTPLALHVMA